MKKIKVIQYAMMFIALWTTLYLIDSIEVSKKEFIADCRISELYLFSILRR